MNIYWRDIGNADKVEETRNPSGVSVWTITKPSGEHGHAYWNGNEASEAQKFLKFKAEHRPPLTNLGKRPIAADVMSSMTDKAFGKVLMDWASGGDGAQQVGSAIYAGQQPSAEAVAQAIGEFERGWQTMTDGDRVETLNIANELRRRFMDGHFASWVRKNCKFAQAKTYNRRRLAQAQPPGMQFRPGQPPMQPRLLNDQEIQQIVSGLIPRMQGIAMQDPDPLANWNAAKKQIQMALQGEVKRLGGALRDMETPVMQVMTGLGLPNRPPQSQQQPAPAAPAGQRPMQQGPHGWEPPGMSSMRTRPQV